MTNTKSSGWYGDSRGHSEAATKDRSFYLPGLDSVINDIYQTGRGGKSRFGKNGTLVFEDVVSAVTGKISGRRPKKSELPNLQNVRLAIHEGSGLCFAVAGWYGDYRNKEGQPDFIDFRSYRGPLYMLKEPVVITAPLPKNKKAEFIIAGTIGERLEPRVYREATRQQLTDRYQPAGAYN